MNLLAHKHIVIAEDEVATLRSLVPFFNKQGCRVTKANNGAEAIRLILYCIQKQETIDFVLSDIYMPDMTGWDIADKLNIEHGIELPFLFMTGDTQIKTKKEFEKRRCHHYLQKPFTHKELLDGIDELLKTSAGKAPESD